MAKKLTSVELTWKQPVLHDIFEAGGLLKRPVRTSGKNRVAIVGRESAAKIICDEISFRNFDFHKTDLALGHLANYVSFMPLHDRSKIKTLTEKQLANIIAAFCAEQEIFWDDINTHRTTVEMDTYRKSYLGAACWDFKCFLSQQATKKPATSSSRASTPRVAGAGPKSGYKSSGPKSGEIKGLIGKPGEKIIFGGITNLAVICCTSSKPKGQYVFIDPVAIKADINKVKLGDPSGYTSCKLFFDSVSTAETAIEIIKRDMTIPEHITDFVIKKQPADPNGYFKVDTEVGPAYIKASKLNEEITEEMTDASKVTKSRFPEIMDIESYNEAMYRYE